MHVGLEGSNHVNPFCSGQLQPLGDQYIVVSLCLKQVSVLLIGVARWKDAFEVAPSLVLFLDVT